MVAYLMTGLICDFIPVIMLIIFHYKNFRVKNEEIKSEEILMEYHEEDEASEVCHLDLVENDLSLTDIPSGLSNDESRDKKTRAAEYTKSTLINEQENDNEIGDYLNSNAYDFDRVKSHHMSVKHKSK